MQSDNLRYDYVLTDENFRFEMSLLTYDIKIYPTNAPYRDELVFVCAGNLLNVIMHVGRMV